MNLAEKQMNQSENELIKNTDHLEGVEKAAIFLIALGAEKASKILKELKDSEVEQITKSISEMKNVNSDVVDSVSNLYFELMSENKFLIEGGNEVAKKLLVSAKGQQKADEFIRKMEASQGVDAFSIIQDSEIENIIRFMKAEHPQIAAVILAHLNQIKAAEILSKLPEDFRTDVAFRMARLGKISPEVVEEVSKVIKDQLADYTDMKSLQKGSGAVAGILNETDISTEQQILQSIEKTDPDLAQEIKDQMFLFDDILDIEDRTMQTIIGKLNKQDLVIGLKGVTPEMKTHFTENMSSRAKEILEEDLEAAGPVHIKQVEEARQNILRKIKELEQDGKISLRTSEDEMLIE